MSKQTSNHDFPEPHEDEEDLDLPQTEELDIEYDHYDHDFRDYLGDDDDREEEEEYFDDYDYLEYDERLYDDEDYY